MPSIPALGRQRQVDLSEFKTSLVYTESSRTGSKTTQTYPALKNKNKSRNICIRLLVFPHIPFLVVIAHYTQVCKLLSLGEAIGTRCKGSVFLLMDCKICN